MVFCILLHPHWWLIQFQDKWLTPNCCPLFIVFWDSRADRMRNTRHRWVNNDFVHLTLILCVSVSGSDYCFLPPNLSLLPLQEQPVLSAGLRSGGQRASGPGRHRGAAAVAAAAAAALISPVVSQPPPTASGHTCWDMKRIFHDDRRGRGWLARRSWQNQEQKVEEEEGLTRGGSYSLLPPFGRCPLLPPPRDNSGPLSTDARLLVTEASTAVLPPSSLFYPDP